MYSDEGHETNTSRAAFLLSRTIINKESSLLKDTSHLDYLIHQMDKPQNISFSMLYPWMASWISNGLFTILGREKFYSEVEKGGISKLQHFANDIIKFQTTGISGGKDQLPNLGNTYAGLVLLKTLGRVEEIDKKGIISFIREMRTEKGFSMYQDGEEDIRATYCALSSFSLLFSTEITENTQFNPLDHEEGKKIFENIDQIIYTHQTYEGGFGGFPLEEAHGGYTFCALASLKILQKEVPNIDLLKNWLRDRQDSFSYGFSGRTQKGVDSCYNFWIGACFKMLNYKEYSTNGLITYTLSNCQAKEGGLKNIPNSQPDIYHTAYALIGLYILESPDFNYILCIPTVEK